MPSGAMSEERYQQILADIEASKTRRAAGAKARMVRGRPVGDWSEEIRRLKREGKLEAALQLTYECMDAAERASMIEFGTGHAGSLYEGAAIILRKMGDYDSEVRLLERVTRDHPRDLEMAHRLVRAQQIAHDNALSAKVADPQVFRTEHVEAPPHSIGGPSLDSSAR